MNRLLFIILFVGTTCLTPAQNIPFKMEELSATEFIKAVDASEQTCIIPIGVFEKHGAHLPLGTDLYIAREIAIRAAQKEYVVVFPEYYFSQVNEARHQPGTIAYSPELIWKILQETLDELSRNGFKKIILVNGHGGNNAFLDYFGMSQMSKPRDYALYWFRQTYSRDILNQVIELTQDDPDDGHGGNRETSMMLAVAPELVQQHRAGEQSGKDQKRMTHLGNTYSGIWWYARFPNHYAGDGSKASAEAGELMLSHLVDQLIEAIKTVKSDETVPELQNQYFRETQQPLKTIQ